MLSFIQYWIFSIIFCSLYASSLQVYADYDQDDYMTEYTENQFPLDDSDMLLQTLKNSYYNLPPSDSYSDEEPSQYEFDKNRLKRSRYYRKYPGKRQNRRIDDIYECNPNSRETIRLLFAIHQARQGDIDHIIFCNRLRNPKTLIPNPRYIGKRSF